jgi:nitrite reductase (NADH) large subunit
VLGVEVAEALQHLGLQVILLQRADRLMNAQLDEAGSLNLTRYLTNIGIQVVTSASVTRFEGQARIVSAWLAHGPRVSADIFVACLGVEPNMLLAEGAGLATGRGIKVDAAMRTSDAAIYAAGDVAEPEDMAMTGLWPSAVAQAELAVAAMLGAAKPAAAKPAMLRLKSEGIDLFSFGGLKQKHRGEVWVSRTASESYWSIVLDQGLPTAGIFVGLPGSGKTFSRLLQEKGRAEALSALRHDGQRQR